MLKKLLFSVILVLMFISCTSLQKGIDRYSLYRNKKAILKDFSPGNPDSLARYIAGFNLEDLTAVPPGTAPYSITPLEKWHISSGKMLTYEKWTFKSGFFKDKLPGDALFYVIKQSDLQNSSVILWVPGFGISNTAFMFVKNFFTAEINAGYNIVIYVPPYHMERQLKGKSPGSGLITASPLHTITEMINAVKELRMVYTYLKSRKVTDIGTWGGSMGGALTLMLQSVEAIDSMGLMIPVLNWNTFITPEEEFPRYRKAGFSKELLTQAYHLISPIRYPLTVSPERIQIEAAEFDQLNPIDDIIEYSRKHGIKNIYTYKSAHASILLNKKIYPDYAEFLKNTTVAAPPPNTE